MKRFHVHLVVENIEHSIDFYNKLFGQQPAKRFADYAKWMLEDPRVNFAISARGHATGVNHFGFQVDSPEELLEIKALAETAAPGQVLEQGQASCCYAKSEKHWTIDPTGLAWEHFHTLTDSQEFGDDNTPHDGACCIPLHGSDQDPTAACCLPNKTSATPGTCCGG